MFQKFYTLRCYILFNYATLYSIQFFKFMIFIDCHKNSVFNYNLGLAGRTGLSNEFTPRVFNFLRNTLSPADTYRILKSAPPKQTFEACPFDAGIGIIASTLPN